MTVRIHVGAHKTATTHLQSALREVRADLARAGMGYIGPGRLRGGNGSLEQCLRQPGRAGAASRAVGESLRAARAQFGDLLLSEENILGGTRRSHIFGPEGMLYPRAVERLRYVITLLGRPRASVFLSVRDPASFVVSAFHQQVLSAREVLIEDYVRDVPVAALGWAELAGRIAAMPSVTRVIVWRYEDYRALRPEICARMLRPELAGLVPDPAPNNTGMSQAAYELYTKRALEDIEAPLKDLVKEAMRALPRGPDRPGLRLLDDETYARSAAHYAAEIERIAQIPGVELLRPPSSPAPAG
ncbi:MAG: hypothetical protein Q4F71_09885 [Paracoccus sp. (in: a-proteobacteria)]|nr:hypothetical protein [Paracoccus sp. (in: a-proteobacteria)]